MTSIDPHNQDATAAQLREKEAQYRGIFEATSDGVIIVDLAGTVIEANPAACRMHGYEYVAFIGLAATTLIHPDSRATFAACLAAVSAGRPFEAQLASLRRDGTPLAIEVRASALRYNGQPHMLAVVRDITERALDYQMLEQRVLERTHELATLLEVSHSLASTLELQPLIGLILDQLKAVVDYHAAAVFILESPTTLRLLKYQGPIPQEDLDRHWLLAEAGHSHEVIRSKRPLIIPNVRADTPMARAFQHKAILDLGAVPDYISSWMGVPLLQRNQVLGILAVDHSELGFYTSHHADLALAFANNAAIAIENARLFGQAQGLAALIERQRLARELHDSVSQALYGIALGARTARALLDIDPRRAVEPLDYVLSLADAGMAEMRALIFELRPESLETEGLVAAFTKHAASLRARYGIAVNAELGPEPDLPVETKEALYRVGQEALHNAVKHARATRIDLRLVQHDGTLTLDVRDDGQGFDPTAAFPGHLGLTSMRERVARLHGTLTLDSAPGHGTHITVTVPVVGRQ